MKTDAKLKQDVLNELEWQPSIHHEQIGVSVDHGVVTLSGIVKSFAEKLEAEKAARRVAGVKAIAENLEVRYDYQPKTADPQIAKRVVDVLDWDPLVPSDKIDVMVEDGVVRLGGKVDWLYQKDMAFKAASKISGVIRIDNRIEVAPRVEAANIRDRIEDAFERQADLESNRISVRTEGRKVILSGTVDSYSKRGLAEHAAWGAPGVTMIEDNITVA